LLIQTQEGKLAPIKQGKNIEIKCFEEKHVFSVKLAFILESEKKITFVQFGTWSLTASVSTRILSINQRWLHDSSFYVSVSSWHWPRIGPRFAAC
jgi:hypothetical protein